METVADADLKRIGAGLGEQAVVESAAAAKASAVFVEGEAGADKGIDLMDRDFG